MDENNKFVKTTIYIPTTLLNQAKIMAVLTETSVSALVRVALRDKIAELKKKKKIV